jgi:hypothetical protein
MVEGRRTLTNERMSECSETATFCVFPKYKIPSRNKDADVSLSSVVSIPLRSGTSLYVSRRHDPPIGILPVPGH